MAAGHLRHQIGGRRGDEDEIRLARQSDMADILFVVAISVGFGMIPLVAPNFFRHLPHGLHPLLESGILLSAIVAVALNFFFNGMQSAEKARAAASATAATAEHV